LRSALVARPTIACRGRETRRDIIDRWPKVGDYLVIHAGFAIHTLDPGEAEINPKLMREMAKAMRD